MKHSTAILGFSWLILMNCSINFAAVLPMTHIIENTLDDSPFRTNDRNTEKFELKDWVMVKATPSDSIRVAPGDRVELECTVFGSPLPQAHWSRGIQLNEITVGPNEFEDSGEFQEVGKVTIRHIIDCVQPHHQGVYTCIGQAREQTMASEPVAISVEGRPVQCSKGKIRITKWSPIITQLIGSTVVIPCTVTDNAPFRQYWKDNFGNVINNDVDQRRKLGPEGELILNNLNWSDMGEYSCVAENAISRDTTSTFLYPMLPNA
jgi:hypothetical protein